MHYLKSIHIKNFKIHRDFRMDFSSGINTIVGPTGSGKSTILKALEFVLYNTTGAGCCTAGEKATSVVLDLGDISVGRHRGGKQGNCYTLIDNTATTEIKYSAVGQGKGNIPEDIADVLAVCDNNIQRQFDSHFWLSNTGSQNAQNLNKIADLEGVDKAVISARLKYSRKKSEVTLLTTQLAEAKVELEQNGPQLEKIGQELRELADMLKLEDIRQQSIDIAEKYLNSTLRKELDMYIALVGVEQSVIEGLQDLRSTLRSTQSIQKFILACEAVESLLEYQNERESIIHILVSSMQDLRGVFDSVAVIQNYIDKNDKISKDTKSTQLNIVTIATKLTKARAELIILEGICPTCQRKL